MLRRALAAPPAPPGFVLRGPFGAPQDEGGGFRNRLLAKAPEEKLARKLSGQLRDELALPSMRGEI